MKLEKNICLRITVFVLIFLYLLVSAQEILRNKGETTEDLAARYASYRDQVASGTEIDVVYMGSSPVYAAVAPMVIWNECGYTGINLGTSTQNVMSLYYSLLEILEFAHPKVVTLDFRDLCETRLADDTTHYYSYRKTIDTLQSPGVKWKYHADIVKSTGSLEHIFTISQFHDRWDSLTKEDFIQETSFYIPFTKGALMNDKHLDVTLVGTYDIHTEPKAHSDFSLEYYERIVDLCNEKNIQLVAVIPPTSKLEEHMAEYTAVHHFCEEHDIPYLDYNDPQLQEQIDLDFSTDYYDRVHLNISGCLKLSKLLAVQLDQLCDLPDRKADPDYASWNEDFVLFYDKYMSQE